MVKLWLLRGLKKRIITTKYPNKAPTDEEIPSRSLPPVPTDTSDWRRGEEICPTGAIEQRPTSEQRRIDLGKCIYCRKCSEAGFEFPDDSTTNSLRASLATREVAGENGKSSSNDELFQKYAERWKTTTIFKRSFHILLMDVGSCNACNLEVLNLSNPYYYLNRLGIFFTNSPKHADALVLVGALNKAMVDVLKRTYASIPNPKLVIAVGACSISGGVFQETESFVSPIKDVIPVDVVVPGCPPSPIQILQGLLLAMRRLRYNKPRRTTTSEALPIVAANRGLK